MTSNTINNNRSSSPSPSASFTNISVSAPSSPAAKPVHVSRFVEQMDTLDAQSETASTRSTSSAAFTTAPAAPTEKSARLKAFAPSMASVLAKLKSSLGYVGLGVTILILSPLLITGAIVAGTIYGYQKLFQLAQQRFYAQPDVSAEDVSVKQD